MSSELRVGIPQMHQIMKKKEPEKVSNKEVADLALTSGLLLATNTVMAGALQQVWSMINGMQLFVHVPMLGVPLPETSENLIGQLVNIATLDLLPTDIVYEGVFDDLPDEEDSSEVDQGEEVESLG